MLSDRHHAPGAALRLPPACRAEERVSVSSSRNPLGRCCKEAKSSSPRLLIKLPPRCQSSNFSGKLWQHLGGEISPREIDMLLDGFSGHAERPRTATRTDKVDHPDGPDSIIITSCGTVEESQSLCLDTTDDITGVV